MATARTLAVVGLALCAGAAARADEAVFTTGPLIAHYGPVAEIEGAAAIPADAAFRVAFDVGETSGEGVLNRRFESVARFLNMHAAAGVPAENMSLALVVHGQASRDLVVSADPDAPNPNVALIEALSEAGVDVYLCGQSAAYHGIDPETLAPGVTVSLSAMTAHALLQADGYTLNPF